MKETQELALAVKSVTNTGFIQLKPLHSLIRKEWLERVYFRRLASVSARTAACSELVSGVILLSLPPLSKPQGSILQRVLPSTRTYSPVSMAQPSSRHHTLLTSSEVHHKQQHTGKRAISTTSLIYSNAHLPGPTMRCLLQDTWPVKLERCQRKHLPKALPQLHSVHVCLVLALELCLPDPPSDQLHVGPMSPELAKATAATLPAQDPEQ